MGLDVFRGYGVRVKLPEKGNSSDFKERTRDAFHVVKETLTRMGVASIKTKTLYQSCHILAKRGEFSILMFKELFLLDGKFGTLSEEDIGRRNVIINLLEEWGLLEIIDKQKTMEPIIPLSQVKVISFSDKQNWNLVAKYQIGKKN